MLEGLHLLQRFIYHLLLLTWLLSLFPFLPFCSSLTQTLPLPCFKQLDLSSKTLDLSRHVLTTSLLLLSSQLRKVHPARCARSTFGVITELRPRTLIIFLLLINFNSHSLAQSWFLRITHQMALISSSPNICENKNGKRNSFYSKCLAFDNHRRTLNYCSVSHLKIWNSFALKYTFSKN